MMSKSTFISAALHTAILLWVLVAFPAAKIDQQLLSPSRSISPRRRRSPSSRPARKDAKDDAPLAGKPKEKQPEAVKEVEAKKPEDTAAVEQKSEPEPKPSPSPRRRRPTRRSRPRPSLRRRSPRRSRPSRQRRSPAKKPAPPKPKREQPRAVPAGSSRTGLPLLSKHQGGNRRAHATPGPDAGHQTPDRRQGRQRSHPRASGDPRRPPRTTRTAPTRTSASGSRPRSTSARPRQGGPPGLDRRPSRGRRAGGARRPAERRQVLAAAGAVEHPDQDRRLPVHHASAHSRADADPAASWSSWSRSPD